MSTFFSDIMKNGALDSLTPDQLDELIARATEIRSESLKIIDDKIECCPHCESIAVKKHGKTSGGNIRMICKDCNKSYTKTDTPHSRLTKRQISALYSGVVENLPIKVLAERMGVSQSTAHRRKLQLGDILFHRMMEELNAVDEHGNPTFTFEGVIQCDEVYQPVSFKGKRDPEFFIWKQKRFPRHHMTYAEQVEYLKVNGLYEKVMAIPGYIDELRENTITSKRGISNDQVCILTAVDDMQRIIAKPVSVGRLETADARKLLGGRLVGNSTFVTDSHGAYPTLAKQEKVPHVQIPSGEHSNGGFNLGAINGIHSQIEKMLPESAERLPATKYLNQYMAIFIWIWQHKALPLEDRVYLLKKTIADSIGELGLPYEDIKSRPLDINTKGQFPNVV